jgi:ATP adenylyltransferase
MNLYPYTSGHLMVVPYAHLGKISETGSDQMNEMMTLSRHTVGILEEVYSPDGFNIGMNIGECAGAGVRDHLHLHVVPRWCGDVNFMTVTGETRVLPEDLAVSYQKLRPLFEREVAR